MTRDRVAPSDAPRQHVGPLLVIGPWQSAPGRWRVEAVDEVLEERATKEFDSKGKAQVFLAALVSGQDAADPLSNADAAVKHGKRSNDANQSAFGQLAQSSQLDKKHTRTDTRDGAARDPESAPFNLRAVREVLTEYELDPFAELAKVLMRQEPLVSRAGSPVLDDEGKPVMVDRITGVERAKVLVELAQYVSPKLKAVEMKVEDNRTMTDEQLAQRINALMGKLAQRQEGAT